ncbi:acyltransferase [Aestuariispira insulae]|uniref:Maltose O-acetyltransferase n=1 Tax=Aestuariispira insulae TaxID=1461337 RepID=A0A3D9H469_9PROT|nr:acyltransferase [Aestuariispira insulae]RED44304.1 maltose O-acetyltransferase [Aestuariispira insulae]
MKRLVRRWLLRLDRMMDETRREDLKRQLGRIGEGVLLKRDVMIIHPKLVTIGDHTHVGERVYIRASDRIEIGSHCQIANNVIIVNADHIIDGGAYSGRTKTQPIKIGNNVWLAAGAKILGGVTIGDNAVVAAGAVVNKDVSENTIVGGIPAKVIRRIETLGNGVSQLSNS